MLGSAVQQNQATRTFTDEDQKLLTTFFLRAQEGFCVPASAWSKKVDDNQYRRLPACPYTRIYTRDYVLGKLEDPTFSLKPYTPMGRAAAYFKAHENVQKVHVLDFYSLTKDLGQMAEQIQLSIPDYSHTQAEDKSYSSFNDYIEDMQDLDHTDDPTYSVMSPKEYAEAYQEIHGKPVPKTTQYQLVKIGESQDR